MIDIGVNLGDKAFEKDRQDIVQRALEAGVTKMILTGTSVEGSRRAAELCDQSPQALFSTAGVHPHDAKSFVKSTVDELSALASSNSVVAIGECGLDFNRDFSPRPKQRDAFQAQVELACELSLPVFVHERDASEVLLEILDGFGDALPPLVVHCFTGDQTTLDEYVQRGFHIGITGWICDERRGLHLRELVSAIPGDRLMIETDAPYLLPRTIRPRPRSRRNEPSFLPYVVATLGEQPDDVAARTTAAATRFFRLPEQP